MEEAVFGLILKKNKHFRLLCKQITATADVLGE